MMDCHQAGELLSLHLDRELDAGPERAVERHLEDCAPCRAHYAELERNRDLLATLPRVRMPDGLFEKVVTELQTAAPRTKVLALPAPRGRFWSGRRVLAAAAAVVLFCLGALTMLGYYSEEPGLQVAARPVVNRHALDSGSPLLGEPPMWTTASYVPGGREARP